MNAHDYIVKVLGRLSKKGPMTWHHAVRIGWAPGEYNIGKAGARRRILLRAIEKDWIAVCGDKLMITPHGRRELRDALRAI
uniref:Uncharacterized protein n=1 Tax=Podoviridae sp. ctjUd6 TaxID=2825270 RepID=A0A8S5U2R5_9CAUD|nr:MAG TPA: hypothetical protein [Podoviridae sp. ctjUd6]